MKYKATIVFLLFTLLISFGSTASSADDFVNIIGQPVKDSKSQSRLTVICQRKNQLKLGKLHDDLYVMYQSSQKHGNGEQILSKAGREILEDMEFSAKKISATRDGISVDNNFDDVTVANKLNKVLDDPTKPADAVKAQINTLGHMVVFLKEDPKDERFILRTYQPEISDLRDRMNKLTFYKCKFVVLPEPKDLQSTNGEESCEVSKDDPSCIPLDVESIQ